MKKLINIMTVLAFLILFLLAPIACKNASPLEGSDGDE